MPLKPNYDITEKEGSESGELTLRLDDDLKRYLTFLESSRLIRDREEAILAALRIYKKLNMHDWLQYVYRLGDQRILMLSHGMLNDIFTSVSEAQLYDIARMSALKRRVVDPFDPLENLGWGKFSRNSGEVMVEFLGVPIAYLKGYIETLFQAEFSVTRSVDGEVYVLNQEGDRQEVWR